MGTRAIGALPPYEQWQATCYTHACSLCEWEPALPASAAGTPPPVL